VPKEGGFETRPYMPPNLCAASRKEDTRGPLSGRKRTFRGHFEIDAKGHWVVRLRRIEDPGGPGRNIVRRAGHNHLIMRVEYWGCERPVTWQEIGLMAGNRPPSKVVS
jgi:hypothetical protein